jgi:hypothetical protein
VNVRAHRGRSGWALSGGCIACAPGASPSSSQPSSTTRSSRRRERSDRALVTVGRRAATRSESTAWVSRSGSMTPSVRTLPQRLARCQRSRCRAHVDARLVDDRHVRREVPRTLDGASEQPRGELWVVGALAREALIQHREPARFEHRPERLQREGRLGLRLPRTQHVALAEQLGTESPPDLDPVEDQPSEYEQADTVPERREPAVDPRPRTDPELARHARLERAFPQLRLDRLGQVRVLTQDVADARSRTGGEGSTGGEARRGERLTSRALCQRRPSYT